MTWCQRTQKKPRCSMTSPPWSWAGKAHHQQSQVHKKVWSKDDLLFMEEGKDREHLNRWDSSQQWPGKREQAQSEILKTPCKQKQWNSRMSTISSTKIVCIPLDKTHLMLCLTVAVREMVSKYTLDCSDYLVIIIWQKYLKEGMPLFFPKLSSYQRAQALC